MKAIAAKKQMHRMGLIPIVFINFNTTTDNLFKFDPNANDG